MGIRFGFLGGEFAFIGKLAGNDMLYADYSSNQYAFTAGYQHWTNRNSKKNKPPRYNSENEYVCHGFIDQSTGEIHQQR